MLINYFASSYTANIKNFHTFFSTCFIQKDDKAGQNNQA